jgi:hypothetical protein
MDDKQAEIDCPCCGSRILFDVRTAKILRWSRKMDLDPSGRPVVREEDWSAAQERVRGRLDSAADKLESGLERERRRAEDLDELFRKASEKLRDDEED